MSLSQFILRTDATCVPCGFTTSDIYLFARHTCETEQHVGRCEDYPCCGHESGDCNGLLYGSDEYIREQVYEQIRSGHGDCNHEEGQFFCDWQDEEDDEDGDED